MPAANKRNAERSFGSRNTQPLSIEEYTAKGYGDFKALAEQSTLTVDADGLIDFNNFTISKLGVEAVTDRATEKQWWDLVTRLLRLNERTQVVVGDLLRIGELKWGRTYELVAAETGYSKKTLRNCRYVMDKVQLSLRRDNLTFNHYALVASMKPDEQARWLESASSEDWSVKTLREKIHGSKKRLDQGATTLRLERQWKTYQRSLAAELERIESEGVDSGPVLDAIIEWAQERKRKR